MKRNPLCLAALGLSLCLMLLSACQSRQFSTGSFHSTAAYFGASSSLLPPPQKPELSLPKALPLPEPAPEPEPAPKPAPEPQPEPAPPPAPVEKPNPVPEPPPKPEPALNTKLYILMYHHFVPDGVNYNDWTTTVTRFREDLQWLTDQGYTLVLPSEVAKGDALPEKAAMLTIDDGYASNYTLAYPILQEYQAKVTISLIAQRIETGHPEFLTWDMCREMADSGLVEFGSHTYDLHGKDPRGIKRISGESWESYQARVIPDLQTSIDLIGDNLGREVLFFAFPHGQTESWAGDFIKDHFLVTVTTRHGPANIANGLYYMPRHNITVAEGVSAYLP